MKFILLTISLLASSLLLAVETYELRVYNLVSAEAAEQFDVWMKSGGMASFKAAGADTVGVFKPRADEDVDVNKRFVLATFDDLDDLKPNRIEPFLKTAKNEKAEAFLAGDKQNPSYTRVETSLLTAARDFKQLKDPRGNGGKERFFELRIYESSSERLAALKMDMFNDGGEIALFKETGLEIVFFGSARIAANFPQLTYMLVHENQEASDKSWKTFINSDGWQTMKAIPKYKGTVSKIHKHLLVALPYSEVR
ncbi:MAG: NIPSNAP family protein [Puniceicoccaceae bacterium]